MKPKFICFAVLGIFLFLNSAKSVSQEVSYYFAAHQDDWQLFMGSHARADISTSNSKVVFVTLTAGDSGWGDSGYSVTPYYRARENGSVKSAQFIANIGHGYVQLNKSTRIVNGHKILVYTYRNAVCYFLRLPGGNQDGSGFAGVDSSASLEKLRTGAITHITAVEHSTTYTSWNDFTNTLNAIIKFERGADTQVWINIPSTDRNYNPGDHSDHYNTGYAAANAVSSLPWVGIVTWMDYYSNQMPPNLTTSQIEDAAAMHACDVVGMTEGGYWSNWNPDHLSWIDKDYFKIYRYPTSATNLTAEATFNEKSTTANNSTVNDTTILNVYPNPVNRNARKIEAEVNVKQPCTMKFFLVSSSGVPIMDMVEKSITRKAKITIPFKSDVSAGIYYLTIITDNNVKVTRKILIE